MIDHATLTTKVTLSERVFLNLAVPKKTVFVKVTNTSDVQGIPLEETLKDRLAEKNIVVVNDLTEAQWIIQANLTSLTYQKLASMEQDLGQVGAAVGGIAGAPIPGSSRDSWLGAAAGSMVGNVIGTVAGSLVKVESYVGAVDVQIQEKLTSVIKGKMKTEAKQGTSTTMVMERDIESEYQIYRTTMRVEATRTNINLEEAKIELANKIADQISGLF